MTAIYLRALRVAYPPYRPPPQFKPDPPERTWMEPCDCPSGTHATWVERLGWPSYLAHLNTIYRTGKRVTAPTPDTRTEGDV